jgi:hypothetical protein
MSGGVAGESGRPLPLCRLNPLKSLEQQTTVQSRNTIFCIAALCRQLEPRDVFWLKNDSKADLNFVPRRNVLRISNLQETNLVRDWPVTCSFQ